MAIKSGNLKARPYARLLTMIGDQLIKNERIAMIELIKNSYDADADWVQVRFVNFDEKDGDLVQNDDSYIEIEDDGEGMTLEILQESWMNPAAPNKFLQKERGKDRTKKKKRIIQGEKGIGRYAIYKIGSTVELITRSFESQDSEIVLENDLSVFDDELIAERGKKNATPKFLDEIRFHFEQRKPLRIIEKEISIRDLTLRRMNHGTVITIRNLRSVWNRAKIQEVIRDVTNLNTPFADETVESEFIWDFQINGKSVIKPESEKDELHRLFERAPVKLTEGTFDSKKRLLKFTLNDRKIEYSLERLRENKEFRNHFCEKSSGKIKRLPECGSFGFQFFVFDLTSQASPKFQLDVNETTFVKSHRIYLYRDGIRVYPYGDPTDDWLGIDILRGTGRAGDYLSNDQTIGYVTITRFVNHQLKDKTSREGLLEIGSAFADFRVLIQSILGILHKEFKKYKSSTQTKRTIFSLSQSELLRDFQKLIDHLHEVKDSSGNKIALDLRKQYEDEREYLVGRARTTEDLAAVGLTVESTSHDLMIMINRAKATLEHIHRLMSSPTYDRTKLTDHLENLKGQVQFISYNIEGIQPIFRSSKRGERNLDVREVVLDVRKYYDDILAQNDIHFGTELEGKPLRVKTTEAVLLQTFVNLLDNAVYWLTTTDIKNKEILVVINSQRREVVFADNGPGIDDDDLPFVFEPYFTTKGIEGRGLGLYIARQLLERSDFGIEYSKSRKVLPGANFKISFAGGK